MRRVNLYISFILLAMFSITSCMDSESNSEDTNNEKVKVVFSLKLPAKSNGVETYALTASNENEIKTIDILVFDNSGNYVYTAYCNSITSGAETSTQQFTATLATGQYDLVILANARNAISTNYSNGIPVGTPKSTVMGNLTITNSGKWVTNTTDPSYVPIPMWGETGLTTITNATVISNVNMVRMLAKINVSLTPAAKANFTLQSVHVYNLNNKGTVVPSTTATNWDAVGNKVLKPTIPSSSSINQGPFLYDGSDITTGDSSIGAIYTFEAAAGSSSNLTNNTCLIIGGTYTDGKTYYYRADFVDNSSNYLDILRNYQYNVSVQTISGPGYPTAQLAFESIPVNITANIVSWSDGGFSNVVFDGQYMMAVSQGEFTFSQEARTASSTDNITTITTDYPQGWTVSKIVDQTNSPITWLETNGSFSAINTPDKLTIIASQNTTGANRIGYIYILAGRLNYIITVTQTNSSALKISITDVSNNVIQQLVFPGNVGGTVPAKSFIVNWLPVSATCNINVNTVGSGAAFNFGTGDVITTGSITEPSGIHTYNIQPSAMTAADTTGNQFAEKVSQVTFTVSNGASFQSSNIFLRQINYALKATAQSSYPMDGGQYSLTVKCNTAWTASITSNTAGVLASLNTTSGGNNTSTGDQVFFTTYNDTTNPSKFMGSATITFTSPTGLFPPKQVTVNCINGTIVPTSNSYIVAPSATPLLIPVSQANLSALGPLIGASDAITATLIWTDNSLGINANSNIRKIAIVGTGASAYLAVVPGSGIGNAVISASVNSTIVWSWHIWVTGYDPSLPTNQKTLNGYTLMSVNLGALSTSPNTIENYGLTYQWGRKDPIFNAGVGNEVYNASGAGMTYSTGTVATSGNALQYSVRNPMVFISENLLYQTWNGSNGASSWGPTTKTVYDPCPPGWRVPAKDIWAGLNNSNFPSGSGGRSHSTGGYFPLAGYVNAPSVLLLPVAVASGSFGNYQSATHNSIGKASHLNFDGLTAIVLPDVNDNAYKAYSVRCVKTP